MNKNEKGNALEDINISKALECGSSGHFYEQVAALITTDVSCYGKAVRSFCFLYYDVFPRNAFMFACLGVRSSTQNTHVRSEP